MSTLFPCVYDRYDTVKCCRNVNFLEIRTDPSTRINDDFDYCEEYLRSLSNKILLWLC